MNSDIVIDDLTAVVDAVVTDLLADDRINSPPVDAIDLARRLGVMIAVDRTQTVRARCKTVAGHRTIILRSDDRHERLQWAVAHELGELLAATIFARLGFQPDDLWPTDREQIANLFASRLLLPTMWFAADAECLSCDLPSLKTVYDTASHELIAWRLLDLDEPAVVTIFDNGRLTRRRANFSPLLPAIYPVELAAQREAHQSGSPASRECLQQGRVDVRAWPIHEPHWKREIVYTVVGKPTSADMPKD